MKSHKDYLVYCTSARGAVHEHMTVCAVGKSDAFEAADAASSIDNPHMEIMEVHACEHQRGAVA